MYCTLFSLLAHCVAARMCSIGLKKKLLFCGVFVTTIALVYCVITLLYSCLRKKYKQELKHLSLAKLHQNKHAADRCWVPFWIVGGFVLFYNVLIIYSRRSSKNNKTGKVVSICNMHHYVRKLGLSWQIRDFDGFHLQKWNWGAVGGARDILH